MHRSKVGVTLATILLAVTSVSPAFAANTDSDGTIPSTNFFDINSNGNTVYGFNNNFVYSNNNTLGVSSTLTPSNYNDLTHSSGNIIRSIGIDTGTALNKNVLNYSNLNVIAGRSNSLTNSDSNTITGNANQLIYSNSSTITGNSNQLTGSSTFNSASNTITGNSNVLINSNSTTTTGNNIHITNGNFVAAVGNGITVTGDNTTALGDNSTVSAPSSVAMGANSIVSASNSVALGANSIADQPNTVSVGSPGSERRITNVANGIDTHDAVNVGQLYSTGALAAALTGIMPLAYDPKARTQVGVGVGGYHNENAVAIGINHYVNESLLVNLGLSADGSERMWRGGLTWRLGQTTKRVEPIVDNVEVDKLRSQLQQQQSELEQLKQQVAALTSSAGQTDNHQ